MEQIIKRNKRSVQNQFQDQNETQLKYLNLI